MTDVSLVARDCQNVPLQSLLSVLADWAERSPDAPAILAPARLPLTYYHLHRHVREVIQTLHATGLQRPDRIALLLPQGPELAVALVAVAAGMTCVPLDPAYRAEELAFYLRAFRVQALIIQDDISSVGRTIAQEQGMQLLALRPQLGTAAGLFTLTTTASGPATVMDTGRPHDVAFVMHTSGTTSHPKIVPWTYANIGASAAHVCTALGLDTRDRYLNVVPLFHGSGLGIGLLPSLYAGASAVCPASFEASQFFAWLAEFHPTWYMGVPAIHQAILAHAPLHHGVIGHHTLRFIRAGATVLPRQVQEELERTFQVPVLGSYGMTEANLITCNPLPPLPRKTASVGITAGADVAIMAEDGTLVPAGAHGEIVVRGTNVMAGYENDVAANQEVFRYGWFHTGDEGFLDAEGYLFLTGRLKDIINRGGSKVTPQEVDAALLEHPAVAQALTFPVPHARWGEDVVTAVVLRPHMRVTASHLRQFVTTRLVPFKVPSQVVLVETLPVSATGKVQRHMLAEVLGVHQHAQSQDNSHQASVRPRTPLEDMLTELWATVLGLDHVGLYESFFRLGGDSLVATQLLARIHDTMHVEISFRHFFETPTVGELASHIAAVQKRVPPEAARPLRSGPRDTPGLLSYAQQRLWFLEHLGLSRHAYNLLEAIRFDGPLQVTVLQQSLQAMIARHDILRTTFLTVDGEPRQVIGAALPLPLPVVDLRRLPTQGQFEQVRTLAQTAVQRAFDLTQGPLLRCTLVRLTDTTYVLLLSMHHIITDGWSHGIFWREVAAIYTVFATGHPVSLAPLPIQYADFALWQQQWLQGAVLDTHLAYWKQQLTGVLPLQLPTDHPHPPRQTFRGSRYGFPLPQWLTQAVKTVSQRYEVTMFMTLLAAFQTLLYRYTGQHDIAVGSLIAQRNRVETEGLIGFFVNTLILRIDLAGDPSFHTLLTRVRQITLDAYEHQDLPYEKLLEALRPSRDLSHNPLFQVLFVLHNTPQQTLSFHDVTLSFLEIDPGTARFDLSLEFWDTSEGLRGRFEYNSDLFEAGTITRMAGHLQTLLAGVVVEPEQSLSQFPLLTPEERQRLLAEWNATTAPFPEAQCIHSIFEAQAARTPEAVAVLCGGASLTYRELNRRANQLAHYLRALGVSLEARVGLYTERSLVFVIGLLGILKAGAAYVPLDPAYPTDRLAFMLADAQPHVVLTQAHLVAALPVTDAHIVCLDTHWPQIAQSCDDNPPDDTTPDSLAYILYTSGSTGTPKGVLGVHRATLNALAWMWHTYPFTENEVCCQKTSISFGDAIQELLGPLLRGIRTVLVADKELRELRHFVHLLATHHVTRLLLVPSLLRVLLDTLDDVHHRLPALQLWFTSGEALPIDLVQRFHTQLPGRHLINIYGTSEVSDDTTSYATSPTMASSEQVPIGRPIANTQVYVLDPHLQPVPIGIVGELYVGGVGLTRGYWQRPALTAERFLPHPFIATPGARLYRTGDNARYRPDGQLEYLGRLDQQIQLHGIRIELGEIEAVLRRHQDVREAVVVVSADSLGEPRLVAYVVPTQASTLTVTALHDFLAARLPVAMLPAAFLLLASVPLTPSGKINRRALPAPRVRSTTMEERYVAPSTPREEQIAAIWSDLLGLARVGRDDNFFERGGHSLLAMRLLARLQSIQQGTFSLVDLFARPTLARMATLLETPGPAEILGSAIVPVSREGTLPASIAQEHFWLCEQMLPDVPLFNVPYILRLTGSLDVACLERSLLDIVRRHEALRTTFAMADEQLVQCIAPIVPLPLTRYDLRTFPIENREMIARHLEHTESQRPFALARGPLVRVCLLQLADQEHHLLITLHHILSDAWSLGILAYELAVVYGAYAAGQPSPLPALPIHFADVAHWQRHWQENALLQGQLAYWQEQLREPFPVLDLPTDYPRGAALHIRTDRQSLTLTGGVFQGLQDLSQQKGCTLFMTCLAALAILLYNTTGQEDFCVATLVANRTRPETQGVIGLLVNTVLLRLRLHGNPTCQEVLQRVRTTMLDAYAHQDLPFEALMQVLEREYNVPRATLGRVLLIWQPPLPQPQPRTPQGLMVQALESQNAGAKVALTACDIVLILRAGPQALTGTCLYKTALFHPTTIIQMLADLQQVCTVLSTRPSQELATWGTGHRSQA